MRVAATLQPTGRTSTGFVIPPDVVAALGGGKRPKVTVTINGATYRSSIAPMGGEFWLGVSAANRELTGTTAGEDYEIDLELDTAPRRIDPPADLADALAADPRSQAAFERLSYSRQRAHVESVTGAKRPDTRARRVAAVVEALAEPGR
jgi:hypothetical protein